MDLLSFEYGWTNEQILKLTTREIHDRIKSIYRRRHDDQRFQMGLHGIKCQQPEDQEDLKLPELTEEQAAAMEKQRTESLARIRERANRHG